MLRRPALAIATLALAILPDLAVAQSSQGSARAAAPGMRYAFTMTGSDDGNVARGTMQVLGDRARIDLEKGSTQRVGGKRASVSMEEKGDADSRNYFILTQGGRRLTIVDPEKESYQEMDAASFTGIVGSVMRGLDVLMTMEVEDATVQVQKVGDGGMVAGRPTERWAVIQEFTTNVGMMGKTKREMHRVVTDYWIAKGLALPENPLFELVTRGEFALAQADRDFVSRVERARASLPKGAALRITVTSASSELDDPQVKPPKVRRMDIHDLVAANIDARVFEVPSGYEKSSGKGFNFSM